MIFTYGEKWYDSTVENLSALLRGVISKSKGDYYCINHFHSFRIQKIDLKCMKMFVKSMIIIIQICLKKVKYNCGEKSMNV